MSGTLLVFLDAVSFLDAVRVCHVSTFIRNRRRTWRCVSRSNAGVRREQNIRQMHMHLTNTSLNSKFEAHATDADGDDDDGDDDDDDEEDEEDDEPADCKRLLADVFDELQVPQPTCSNLAFGHHFARDRRAQITAPAYLLATLFDSTPIQQNRLLSNEGGLFSYELQVPR